MRAELVQWLEWRPLTVCDIACLPVLSHSIPSPAHGFSVQMLLCHRCGSCGDTVDMGKDDMVRCRYEAPFFRQRGPRRSHRTSCLRRARVLMVGSRVCAQVVRAPDFIQDSPQEGRAV